MGACQSSTATTTTALHSVCSTTSIKTQGTGRTARCTVTGSDSDVEQPRLHAPARTATKGQPTTTTTSTTQESYPSIIIRKEALKDHDDENGHKKKSEQIKNRPGYSSGGSSLLESSSDEETSAVRCLTRHDRLCEWKQELASQGDLTAKIVRIEVRACDRVCVRVQFRRMNCMHLTVVPLALLWCLSDRLWTGH